MAWTSAHTPRAQSTRRFFTPVTSASLVATPACNFSQIRGTPKNIVGRASLRLSASFSIDSAKNTVEPPVVGMWIVAICSAMCDSGRYDSEVSPSSSPLTSISARAVHARFSCDSITPFGGPVVPDV